MSNSELVTWQKLSTDSSDLGRCKYFFVKEIDFIRMQDLTVFLRSEIHGEKSDPCKLTGKRYSLYTLQPCK